MQKKITLNVVSLMLLLQGVNAGEVLVGSCPPHESLVQFSLKDGDLAFPLIEALAFKRADLESEPSLTCYYATNGGEGSILAQINTQKYDFSTCHFNDDKDQTVCYNRNVKECALYCEKKKDRT